MASRLGARAEALIRENTDADLESEAKDDEEACLNARVKIGARLSVDRMAKLTYLHRCVSVHRTEGWRGGPQVSRQGPLQKRGHRGACREEEALGFFAG